MGLGDVVDELLNQHGLADTSTSEETNLSTTGVGGKKIDDLDTGLEHLSGRGLVDESRRVGMDGLAGNTLDRTPLVDGLTNDVHDTTKSVTANGNLDRSTSVDDLLATDETLGTVHSNGTDGVLAQVRRDLEDETTTVEILDLKGVEDRGKVVGVELNVDDGTNDGLHRTNSGLRLGCVRARCVRKITGKTRVSTTTRTEVFKAIQKTRQQKFYPTKRLEKEQN